MEKLVTNRVTYFVEKHNILSNIQSGFRKGRSTVDYIIRLQDTINKFNNNKVFTVGVFIDFQSAFDMVRQSGLRLNLRNLVSSSSPLHSFTPGLKPSCSANPELYGLSS